MGHAQHREEGEGSPVTEPEYRYGGQWFDDMGSLALSFADSPRVGIDIARSGISRAQANDMAAQLMAAGLTPYEAPAAPLGQEYTGGERAEPEGPGDYL